MTAFRRSNSTDLRQVADDIVSHLDRVAAARSRNGAGHNVDGQPRVPAGNGEESGRWTKEGGDPEPVKLASANAPGDMDEITIHGRPPLTDDQIAAIIFNETRALHGPDLHKARVDMAATIINADAETGGSRAGFGTAPDSINGDLTPDEEKVLQDINAAVAEARSLEDSGNDPTHYATNFDTPGLGYEKPLNRKYSIEAQYPNFWDSNDKKPKKIRIWQNPEAKKHRPQ